MKHRATPADAERVHRLRRAKTGATLLLLVALGVYVVTVVVGSDNGWVGFVRAAAEAAMVGGLADWFAVTALFRHPLRIPIPHTALIPRRKDALGRSLQAFVGENFLTESAVRQQLVTAQIPRRVGAWLAEPAHAERVAQEVTVVAASVVRLIADEDLEAVVTAAIRRKVETTSFAPYVGRMLGPVVQTGTHLGLVDLGVARLRTWLVEHEDDITSMIERQAPYWTPRFVDRTVARRVHAELVRVATEVDTDPDHPLRREFDAFLVRFAKNLQDDPATRDQLDRVVGAALARPEVARALEHSVAAGRAMLVEQLESPSPEVQDRVVATLRRLGSRLEGDVELGARIEDAAGQAVSYLLEHFRDELTRVIADTVDRWDSDETSRRIELQVGRDLQFVRVNGTVVGALAGVVIHALTVAF